MLSPIAGLALVLLSYGSLYSLLSRFLPPPSSCLSVPAVPSVPTTTPSSSRPSMCAGAFRCISDAAESRKSKLSKHTCSALSCSHAHLEARRGPVHIEGLWQHGVMFWFCESVYVPHIVLLTQSSCNPSCACVSNIMFFQGT